MKTPKNYLFLYDLVSIQNMYYIKITIKLVLLLLNYL